MLANIYETSITYILSHFQKIIFANLCVLFQIKGVVSKSTMYRFNVMLFEYVLFITFWEDIDISFMKIVGFVFLFVREQWQCIPFCLSQSASYLLQSASYHIPVFPAIICVFFYVESCHCTLAGLECEHFGGCCPLDPQFFIQSWHSPAHLLLCGHLTSANARQLIYRNGGLHRWLWSSLLHTYEIVASREALLLACWGKANCHMTFLNIAGSHILF